jgi:hypothetical protein
MSDTLDVAWPLAGGSVAGAEPTLRSAGVGPALAVNDLYSFPAASPRFLHVGRRAVMALGCAGLGIALLMQIDDTPALAVQIALMGGSITLGGIVWGVQSILEFLGQLVIDGSGIHHLPAVSGFSIAWDDLQRWEVRDDVPETMPIPSVRFWVHERSGSYSVPDRLLSVADREDIRRILQRRVPQREVRGASH